MPYVTNSKNQAENLQKEKLNQRLELLEYLKTKGRILELYAGRGFLSQVYANFATELILVDKREDYLQEAKQKIHGKVSYKIFCKDNRKFIREDLPCLGNIDFVDFDAFGSCAEQIKLFFDVYIVKKPLLVAVTDGLGLRWGWVCTNYESFEHYAKKYFLEKPKQKPGVRFMALKPVRVPRSFVKFFDELLMMQIAKRYKLKVKKINEFERPRGFPVYLGFLVTPEI